MSKAYKMMFLTILFTGTMISVSSYTWMGMWLGLEINLMAIIPLMHHSENIMSSESSMKYFITQAIASTAIMMVIILMMTKINLLSNSSSKSTMLLILNSSLLTKMGMAPFHFWFPEVMEGLNWLNCLLILTWQKLAPLVLLMYNMQFTTFMVSMILISMLISGVLGINQISLRKILAYSSINHMGWMISTMMFMETIWMHYFIIYSILTVALVMMFNKMKLFYIKQLSQLKTFNYWSKLMFTVNFLSLSGIPPFLGFLPKWLTIQLMTENNMIMLPVLMILLTLMTVYMYIRLIISTILMTATESSWTPENSNNNNSSTWLAIMNFISLTSLVMITIMFNMT